MYTNVKFAHAWTFTTMLKHRPTAWGLICPCRRATHFVSSQMVESNQQKSAMCAFTSWPWMVFETKICAVTFSVHLVAGYHYMTLEESSSTQARHLRSDYLSSSNIYIYLYNEKKHTFHERDNLLNGLFSSIVFQNVNTPTPSWQCNAMWRMWTSIINRFKICLFLHPHRNQMAK